MILKKEKFSPIRLFQLIPLFLYPFISFYCLEYYTHDPWLMEPIPQFLNYIIYLSAGFFLYFLSGSSRISNCILVLYSFITGSANYFVMSFRGNPILPWDLRSFQTALSVSDNYNYEVNDRFIKSSLTLLLLFITGLILYSKKSSGIKTMKRLIPAIISLGFCILISLSMMKPSITEHLLTPTNLFSQWASYRDNGFTVSFLQNLQYMQIQKPSGYRADSLEDEVTAFLENSSTLHANSNSDIKPHVIVIMNESLSDLSVLHEFETNQDYFPYIHSLQNQNRSNIITGNLFVSVCGGNTANSEFEFLTGNTTAFLPSGSVAYQQYISDSIENLTSQMKSNGYQTSAFHPYGASGWNRNKVYPLLGFDHSYFKNDFTNPLILRKYVSDETAYGKLNEILFAAHNQAPQFLFEVTMQNHGGYSEIFDNFPIEVTLNNISTYSSHATENYLTLMKESDRAFKEFINTLEFIEEPTIVLLFGDHQPNDYVSENIASLTGTPKEERTLEESQNRYIVPYVIWANYELEKTQAGFIPNSAQACEIKGNTNILSCNYLGAALAALSNQELTSYQKFLLELRKTLPVITANVVIDADGTYLTPEEARKQYPELLSLYEKLQYHNLFD